MITFKVTKEDTTVEILLGVDKTLLELKKEIIKLFELSCGYIDIISTLDRPIRSMGKFNFDKGIQPRTLDNYPFDRYNLDNRDITITYDEVIDYLPQSGNNKNNNKNNNNKYVSPHMNKGYNINNFDSDINSEIDFPSLS